MKVAKWISLSAIVVLAGALLLATFDSPGTQRDDAYGSAHMRQHVLNPPPEASGLPSEHGQRGHGNQGLPAEVPVPAWAKNKPVHFYAVKQPERASAREGETSSENASAGASSIVCSSNSCLGQGSYAPPNEYGYWSGPLKYHNGLVQHQPKIHVIFWGSNWNNKPGVREKILDLYRWMNGSSYAQQMTQNFDNSGPASPTFSMNSLTDTRVTHPVNIGGAAPRQEAFEERNMNNWGPSTWEDQYVVLPAPGTTYAQGFGAGFCGYHENWDYTTITFVGWQGEEPFHNGCNRLAEVWENMSLTVSHEYAESVTNPQVTSYVKEGLPAEYGWANYEREENADICSEEPAEPAPGVIVNPLWDNYLYQCAMSDVNPPRLAAATYTPVSSVADHTMILQGAINPAEATGNHWDAYYYFLVEQAGQSPRAVPATGRATGYGGNFSAVAENAGVVKGNTSYTVSLWANDRAQWSEVSGGKVNFTTPDWRPQITIQPQTDVRAGHAVLHGTINPEGYDTHYRFEWGKEGAFDHSIPVPDADIGSGTESVAVNQTIEGLKGLTEYHYRIFAENQEGFHTSAVQTFTTPDWRPVVTTEAASEIKVVSEHGQATLKGKVNPRGFATHYRFEWGTKAEYEEGNYGHLIPVPDAEAGSGEEDVKVSQTIGVRGSTTYHFRLVAENEEGKTTGSDKSFNTPDWRPFVYNSAGIAVKATEATLVTRIDPLGFATTYHIEWGTKAEFEEGKYGHTIAGGALGSGEEEIEITKPLGGLKPRSTYHFRVIAENAEGSRTPIDATFATSTSGFVAAGYPTSLEGVPSGGLFTETFAGISTSCTAPTFTAKLEKTGTEFYSGGAEILSTASVGSFSCSNGLGTYTWEMNGCGFEFDPGYGTKGSFEGEFDIGPPGCGPITTNIGYCPLSIGSQIGRAATYTNEVVGGEERVKIALNISDLRYSSPGGGNCAKRTNAADGGLSGTWQMAAKGLKVTPAFEVGPELTTEGSSAVSATGATLHGGIDTMGYASFYGFEYGLTAGPKYESTISGGEIPAGVEGLHAKELTVGDLKPGRIYHYRIAAFDGNGISFGEDRTFTTAPGTITQLATALSGTGATLHGSIDPASTETSYQFEYGTTTAYGSKAPASPKAIGSGKEFFAVSEPITGLSPATIYHFRVASINSEGTTYGEDQTFATWGNWSLKSPSNPPLVNRSELAAVSCSSASLCLASGYDANTGKGFERRWNGSEWVADGYLTEVEAGPQGLACPGATECASVGNTIEVWGNSGGWRQLWGLAIPAIEGSSNRKLYDVSCSSESACTAVGTYAKEGKYKSLAVRLTRTGGPLSAWTASLQSTANPASGSAELRDVSCPSSTSCTAVGTHGTETFAESWNGTSWSIASTPNPAGAEKSYLEAVSCTSASACTAVGYYTYPVKGESATEEVKKALAMRWNGSSWSLQTVANPSGFKNWGGFADVACASASSCTAVGSYASARAEIPYLPGVYFEPTEEKTLAESWNGSEWTVQSSPNPEGPKMPRLSSISCSGATGCTAVGLAKKGAKEAETVTLGERYE